MTSWELLEHVKCLHMSHIFQVLEYLMHLFCFMAREKTPAQNTLKLIWVTFCTEVTTGHMISIFSTISWFLSFIEYLRVRFVMAAPPSVTGQPNRAACHWLRQYCLSIYYLRVPQFTLLRGTKLQMTYSLFMLSS